MIDFLEIDLDDVEKSRYKEFVVNSIDEKDIKESAKVDADFRKAVDEKIGSKKRLNSILYYVTMGLSFLTLILALLLFQQANPEKKEFPVGLLVGVLVCMAVMIGLAFWQSHIKKTMKKEIQGADIQKYGDINRELEDRLLAKLKVPEEKTKIDVFARNVRTQNGKLINALKVSYNNYSLYAYVQNESLYFCDTYELIKLDLKEVQDVKLVKDKITFATWTKKENPRDPKYKPYNIKPTMGGFFSVNSFYDITLKHKDRDYVLRIPGYEKEFVEKVFNYHEEAETVEKESEISTKPEERNNEDQ